MNLFQGDTRKHTHYVPISARAMEQFLDADFILREDIIKIQHKMKSTREKWRGTKYDLYLLVHSSTYTCSGSPPSERRCRSSRTA